MKLTKGKPSGVFLSEANEALMSYDTVECFVYSLSHMFPTHKEIFMIHKTENPILKCIVY